MVLIHAFRRLNMGKGKTRSKGKRVKKTKRLPKTAPIGSKVDLEITMKDGRKRTQRFKSTGRTLWVPTKNPKK